MAPIKDTESFVRRAREIHGTRFDYSGVFYVNNKTPVTFVCNWCEKQIKCRPCDHVREKKHISCSCHRNKTKKKELERELKRIDRQSHRQRLLNRKCKVCGKKLNSTDVRKSCCSRQCGYQANRLERKVVSCAGCGKKIERTIARLKKFDRVACSAVCQRKVAAASRKDWKTASMVAKQLWKRKNQSRRKKSNGYYCAAKRQLSNIVNKRSAWNYKTTNPWEYAIALRLNSSRGRKSGKRKVAESKCCPMHQLMCKRRYFETDSWAKKVGNKLSNIRQRRRRKDDQKGNCFGAGSYGNDSKTRIQMRPDWLEVDPG